MSDIKSTGPGNPPNVTGANNDSEQEIEVAVPGSSRVQESKKSGVEFTSQPLLSRDVKPNTVYERLTNAIKDIVRRTAIAGMLLEGGEVKENALENLLKAINNAEITPQEAQSVLNEFNEELKTKAPKDIMFKLFTMQNLSAKERLGIAQIFEETLTENEKVINFQEWTCFQLMKVESEHPEIDHQELIQVFNELKTGILNDETYFRETLSAQMKNLINGRDFDLDHFWIGMMNGFASTKTALETTISDIKKFKELVSEQIGENFLEAFKKARKDKVQPEEAVQADVEKILESEEFQNLLTAFVADYIQDADPRDIMMLLMNENTEPLKQTLLQKFEEKSLAVMNRATKDNFGPETEFDKAFVKLCTSHEKILSKKEVTKETIKSLMTKIKEAFNQGKLMGIAISVIAAIAALALLGAAVITWPVALSIFGGTVIAFFLYGFIKGLAGRSIEKDLERIEKVQTGVLSVAKLLVPDIETKAADFVKNAPQKIEEEARKLYKDSTTAVVTT